MFLPSFSFLDINSNSPSIKIGAFNDSITLFNLAAIISSLLLFSISVLNASPIEIPFSILYSLIYNKSYKWYNIFGEVLCQTKNYIE